ncbi:MAG: hypothetical protein V1834_02805 [Candidatus Micrarchaeota archaeon]
MVFGLFEGGIEVMTDQTNYKWGDKVTGKIRMKLKGPKKAKALELRFYGVKSGGVKVSAKGVENSKDTQRIAEVRVPISGEQEYHQEEIPFEYQLPAQNPMGAMGSGAAATAMQAASLLTGGRGYSMKWFIEAHLDIPMSVDISKSIQLNVQ